MNETWNDVCSVDDLVANSGVCGLVQGKEVAIFALPSEDSLHVFATSNYDPFGKANVLYRGLLGSQQSDLFVASPLYKQRFCLSTGRCLDDEATAIEAYETQIKDGRVLVQMATAV